MADKKQGIRGSDNSGSRSKREPLKGEAELSREINRRPENTRVRVLMPSMKTRMMSVPDYEAFQAARNG